MILLRQKMYGLNRSVTKTMNNAKLIRETLPEFKNWSLGDIIKTQNLSRYSASANMTDQGNALAVARFIKKNGRWPEVGEMHQVRLKRYNGRYWPESGNHMKNNAKGKKGFKKELKKRLKEASEEAS